MYVLLRPGAVQGALSNLSNKRQILEESTGFLTCGHFVTLLRVPLSSIQQFVVPFDCRHNPNASSETNSDP